MRRSNAIVCGIWLIISQSGDPAESSDTTSVSHRIDQLVTQGCDAAGCKTIGRCGDIEFFRRIWLDLSGRTPPLSDATKIATGTSLDRDAVVQQLFKSAEFSRHWGRIWSEYLTDRRPFETDEYDGRRLLQYLTESFRDNRPYDEMVGNLILGEGTSDVSGSVNFLLRYNAEPIALAGAVSQKILGLSLQCAECHDHPHARWKQKDFWGLAAHFTRLRKMIPVNPEEGESFFVVIERPRGELMVTDKKAKPNDAGVFPRKTVFPQLLDSPRSDAAKQRRAVLVDWLTKSSNPYPSRQLVNVVWDRLMGAKLVHNLDQWPPASANSNTELLNFLAEDFISHHWDMQRLIQAIVLSETYQRSSHDDAAPVSGGPENELELTNWGRSRIRPLSADQLHLSIGQALGYHHDENDHRLAASTGEEFTEDIPVNNLGATSLTLGRSLALYNSDYIRGAAELGAEAAIRLFGAASGAEHIERLFLSLLSRRPTTEELEFFQDFGGENDPRQGIEDVVWVLLNSSEFVTNH